MHRAMIETYLWTKKQFIADVADLAEPDPVHRLLPVQVLYAITVPRRRRAQDGGALGCALGAQRPVSWTKRATARAYLMRCGSGQSCGDTTKCATSRNGACPGPAIFSARRRKAARASLWAGQWSTKWVTVLTAHVRQHVPLGARPWT